jgi:pimeloyl-ACP methyl ester carboxylesterase
MPRRPRDPSSDLLLLLDHLGVRRAHVVGLSMGGGIALDFAAAHPDRLLRLVVVSSGANGYPVPDADRNRIRAIFGAGRSNGAEAAVREWMSHPMLSGVRDRPILSRRVQTLVRENAGIFLAPEWPLRPAERPALGHLGELATKTLVIAGGRDTPFNRAAAAVLVEGVADAEAVTIRAAAHFPNLEEPQRFNLVLLEFLLR